MPPRAPALPGPRPPARPSRGTLRLLKQRHGRADCSARCSLTILGVLGPLWPCGRRTRGGDVPAHFARMAIPWPAGPGDGAPCPSTPRISPPLPTEGTNAQCPCATGEAWPYYALGLRKLEHRRPQPGHGLGVGGCGQGLGRQAGAGLGLPWLPGHCGVSRLYSKTHTTVTGVVKWDVQSGVCLVCVCMCEACACALEHTHACVHVCALCVCAFAHTCVHMSVPVCMCACIGMQCVHTCAQVCVHACACLCVRVCAWAYVCMCRGQRASKWVPSALVPEFKGRHSMWGVIGEGFPEAAGPGGRGQRGIHRRHAAQQS